MAAGRGIYKIAGASEWAEATRKRVAQVARLPYSVVITGPIGSGKRHLARCLHEQSPRAGKPFVPVDCALLRGDLFVSQLFGHEAGALPTATGSGLGALRVADGGTVFLSRIDSLGLEEQERLLHVVSAGRVRPLGVAQSLDIDVRFVASSLGDLQKEVQGQCFLPELYTRLEAVSLHTDELSRRSEDIAPLAEAFLEQVAQDLELPVKRLDARALTKLVSYTWPGNISELEQVVQRAAIDAPGGVITVDDLPPLDE